MEQRLTEEQRDLVTKNFRLARAIANRYQNAGKGDFDDCLQEAAIGLMLSVQHWGPDSSCSFTTACWYGMRSALARASKRYPMIRKGLPAGFKLAMVSLSEPVFEGSEDTLLDTLTDESAVPVDVQAAAKEIKRFLPKNERQREILLRRAAGELLEEVGESLGLSGERVRQLESAALSLVRRRQSHKL